MHIVLERRALVLLLVLAAAAPALAQGPPCGPCVGVVVDDPAAILAGLRSAPPLTGEARLYVSWPVRVAVDDPIPAAQQVAEAGAVPWLRLEIDTPAPPTDHLDVLTDELAVIARIAMAAPARTHFELVWRPGGGSVTPDPAATAFVLKRAAVAVTGAAPAARVLAGGLVADSGWLRRLYDDDLGAYVDGLVLAVPDDDVLAAVLATIAELDPGRPVVAEPSTALNTVEAVILAARQRMAGVALTLAHLAPGAAADPAPLTLIARELAGDFSPDPALATSGGFAFVRGSDLAVRVISAAPADGGRGEIRLADPALRNPVLILPDGSERKLTVSRDRTGITVGVPSPPAVAVLRLERASADELGGFAAAVDVGGSRTMPVAEILSRLQANEDAQARRIDHYEARFTTHLRFRVTEGTNPIEASFTGPFFRRHDGSFDWVWETLYFNGVRWKGEIPELPLIQPEKAAALPLEIGFNRDYSYRLRGTEVIAGRDCWVVEFEPNAVVAGRSLYRGTVWIDRTEFVRVRTRSLQVGLAGDVLSNEETVEFTPLDADGGSAAWSRAAFILPLRTVGQELQSILNTTILVEKESELSEVRINRVEFEQRLASAHASERTMVRDTPLGLRYLERQPDGTRSVRLEDDPDRLFALFGAYYDDSLDYPLPLGGVNWFSRDVAGTGLQGNVFFAGVFVNANVAQPALFGSRWDAGARLFGFFVPLDEASYRDGMKIEEEAVRHRPARLALFLGRPLGAYAKLDLTYGLDWDHFGRADTTATAFRPPASTLTHSVRLGLSYTRAGYSLATAATAARRARWEPWGEPDNPRYDPAQREYLRWSASLAKTWWLGRFTSLAVALEHLDGSDLDRFSGYDFSFFSGSRVAGYPSGLVTADRADGVHLSGGFNLADVLRLEGRADLVWASNELAGLERERLAGIGVSGSLIGPWQTLVTFDVGKAVAGPSDSVSVSFVVLKLFK